MNWNKSVLFFGLLSTFRLLGQQLLPQQMDTSLYQHDMIAFGLGDFASTSVYNEFSKLFLYGGELDNNKKNRSFAQHGNLNKFGYDVTGEIEYRNYCSSILKKKDFGWLIRGGSYTYASANYSKDAFGLVFFGNKLYQGDTATFSGMEFNSISFQKIGFGLINKTNKSNLSLNLYNISSRSNLFVREGILTSSDQGDELSLILDGKYSQTTGANFHKGFGVGMDGDFRLPISWLNDKTAYFQVLFKNIGFMQIHDMDNYLVDSNYTFDGFRFNQVFGNNFQNGSQDILDSLGVDRNKGKVGAMLPGFVQVGKMADELNAGKLQSFFGVRLYTTLAYNPLLYVGGQYKFGEKFRVGMQGSFGGYASFRLGVYGQYNVKKIHLGLGSEDIIGLLSKFGMGQSLIIRIAYKW